MRVIASVTIGERWRLGLIAAVWVVDACLLPFAPFSVAWDSFLPVAFWVGLLAAVAVVYSVFRPAPVLSRVARATAEILVFVLGAAFLNYLGFMAGRPPIDQSLVAADAALGFDWPAFVTWLHGMPPLETVLLLAYDSSLAQVAVITMLLGLTGRVERLDLFLLAFMLSALITIAVWVVFPTVGAYIYYFSLGQALPSDGLAVDPAYARTLLAMQAGTFAPLRFDGIVGLIGFPSFHTCLAVLCAVVLWGIRWVGPASLLLNLVVLLSVPAQGGHHLVDVLGGVAAVVVAMGMAWRMLRPRVFAAVAEDVRAEQAEADIRPALS